MFWGVVLLAILTLAACIATFSALAGSFQGEVILLNFAMNVPMCIIIGYADYKLVALLHKRQKNTDALSIVANVVVSNLAIGSLFILYYLISRPARFDEPESLWQRLLPAILCNSIIVLIIEAFFYNNLFLANKARLAKVEQEKAKYQLENLKRQINPHFLFNTLNMISCMARLEDAATTDQMIVHLGSLFRHNLRTKRQQITLEEELDGLEDYIYLQQMRFDGRITVEKSIRVQPAAVLVPSFMLQPVVENAYSHGLKSREEGGRILLRAWMQGKVLVLTVADNGKGMTAEELDAVQTKIAQSEQTGRSIGLGNISRRIGMLYPGGKMQVYSRAGHGTVVRFELPQTQQPEEKEETLS